ncbi:hypothetical protein [Laspinema olomoucense]|uniref:Uncharacterized protein n=1 Tax=Laspinema olomoucense D3b TaxID=2953688 RepID=A0ABT2ND71_9CYAN|nr:hypothetical protein [Laspinema sp. D3b]MCT7980632.1 hypothetical protein [Laspinema sp. D3b]
MGGGSADRLKFPSALGPILPNAIAFNLVFLELDLVWVWESCRGIWAL